MAGPRLDRELSEMVQSLKTQLALLEDYSRRAFEEGNAEFCPEVASKLRILLVNSRHNQPLLLSLAARLSITLEVVLDGPPIQRPLGVPGPGERISLDAFYNLQAVTTRTSDGLITMSKRELIRAWAEQLGGAHEDWSVDEALVRAVHAPVFINGMQPTVMELARCARTALKYGNLVLEQARKLMCSEDGGA